MNVSLQDAVTSSAPGPRGTKGDVDQFGDVVDLVRDLTPGVREPVGDCSCHRRDCPDCCDRWEASLRRIRGAIGDCVGFDPKEHARQVAGEIRRVRVARGIAS